MRVPALLLLLAAGTALAQEESVARRFLRQEEKAFEHFRQKDWPGAIAAFEEQIAIYAANPRPYYNIACCYSLSGDADRAVIWLKMSISHGWRNRRHLERDPDFDAIRDTDPFRACMRELEEVLRRDPEPLPRRLPPSSAPRAASAADILRMTNARITAVERQAALLEESQLRRRLFLVYDARMAMLTRYLAENGDARDADLAAYARVIGAVRYADRGRGEPDAELVRAAAILTLATSEEFLRGWPGSPLLPPVLLLRGQALGKIGGRERQAVEDLQALAEDHPGSDAGMEARIEVCALLADLGDLEGLRREFPLAKERLSRNFGGLVLMQERLPKARLLAEGVPEEALKSLRALAGDTGEPVLYLFTHIDDLEAERRLPALRAMDGLRTVVLCVDLKSVPYERIEAWLKEHADGLPSMKRAEKIAEELWFFRTPVLLVLRGDEVLAVDPTDEELKKLVR